MITIGGACGSAFDWMQPSRRLVEEGLDYVMLETIGTVATCRAAHRFHQGGVGYHPYLEERMRLILEPAATHGTTIVTNAGIVDPVGAGELVAEIAAEEDVSAQVIAITGDDCTEVVEANADEYGVDLDPIISTNAYIGAEEVLSAFELFDDSYDTRVVIGGRIADPTLAVAPLVHEFGWELDDWDRLGKATIIGHLIECSSQLCGGFFCDPPRKTVPELHNIGFPYAEVESDGTAVLQKPDGTGGRLDRHTVREQLFYELHDPAAYLTPDVTADFTSVSLSEVGPDRVELTGGSGRERPDKLKVLLGSIEGYEMEKYLPFGGPNAVARAAVTRELVERRLDDVFDVTRAGLDLRMELIGANALYSDADSEDWFESIKEQLADGTADVDEHEELTLRIAAKASDREQLVPILRTVATTLPGPASSGVAIPYDTDGIEERAEIEPIYVPRESVTEGVNAAEVTE